MILREVLPKDRGFLADIATKILEPIYGWQYKAFDEWFTGNGFKQAVALCCLICDEPARIENYQFLCYLIKGHETNKF